MNVMIQTRQHEFLLWLEVEESPIHTLSIHHKATLFTVETKSLPPLRSVNPSKTTTTWQVWGFFPLNLDIKMTMGQAGGLNDHRTGHNDAKECKVLHKNSGRSRGKYAPPGETSLKMDHPDGSKELIWKK